MYEKVCIDLTDVLNNVLKGLRHEAKIDFIPLSDHCIHCASVFQDPASLQVAVVVYAIGKIHQRIDSESQRLKLEKQLISLFEKCIDHIKNNNEKGFLETMRKAFDVIRVVDKNISMFVDEVLDKAKLTKGIKIFRHGISVRKTAEILGISSWDLMSYRGKTQILEEEKLREDPKSRFLYAKKIFDVL